MAEKNMFNKDFLKIEGSGAPVVFGNPPLVIPPNNGDGYGVPLLRGVPATDPPPKALPVSVNVDPAGDSPEAKLLAAQMALVGESSDEAATGEVVGKPGNAIQPVPVNALPQAGLEGLSDEALVSYMQTLQIQAMEAEAVLLKRNYAEWLDALPRWLKDMDSVPGSILLISFSVEPTGIDRFIPVQQVEGGPVILMSETTGRVLQISEGDK